jgi:hypothetical protein
MLATMSLGTLTVTVLSVTVKTVAPVDIGWVPSPP